MNEGKATRDEYAISNTVSHACVTTRLCILPPSLISDQAPCALTVEMATPNLKHSAGSSKEDELKGRYLQALKGMEEQVGNPESGRVYCSLTKEYI